MNLEREDRFAILEILAQKIHVWWIYKVGNLFSGGDSFMRFTGISTERGVILNNMKFMIHILGFTVMFLVIL